MKDRVVVLVVVVGRKADAGVLPDLRGKTFDPFQTLKEPRELREGLFRMGVEGNCSDHSEPKGKTLSASG